MRKLQNRLAHTFTYFAILGVLTTHCFESAILFKLMRCTCLWRHYAHARAVWCSWCTLEWLGYPYDELVIPKAIIGREGIWMASRLLTTKIPSALLVVVGWLQHTRYPRFRRGTLGYGVTTSPIQKGKAKGTKFSCECTLVYPCFPNACAMQCMLKSNILNLKHEVVSKTQKNKFRTEESIGSWLTRNLWSTELDWSQLA
jgi:hypothetical protein